MREAKIIEHKKIKRLNKGLLVVGLSGVGLIGKMTVEYIIDQKKAENIATLYTPYFPYEATIETNGHIQMPTVKFYLIKGKKDIILMAGDVQPEENIGQYDLADKVVSYAKKIGVKEIITFGGYAKGKITKSKKIIGGTNNEKFMKKLSKYGIKVNKEKIVVVGAAGLIPGIAEIYEIPAACLLKETHGGYVDLLAAKGFVSFLSEYTGIKINMSQIDKKAKETEKMVNDIEKKIESTKSHPKPISYIR